MPEAQESLTAPSDATMSVEQMRKTLAEVRRRMEKALREGEK
jgi:hypothetical protein